MSAFFVMQSTRNGWQRKKSIYRQKCTEAVNIRDCSCSKHDSQIYLLCTSTAQKMEMASCVRLTATPFKHLFFNVRKCFVALSGSHSCFPCNEAAFLLHWQSKVWQKGHVLPPKITAVLQENLLALFDAWKKLSSHKLANHRNTKLPKCQRGSGSLLMNLDVSWRRKGNVRHPRFCLKFLCFTNHKKVINEERWNTETKLSTQQTFRKKTDQRKEQEGQRHISSFCLRHRPSMVTWTEITFISKSRTCNWIFSHKGQVIRCPWCCRVVHQ